MRRADRPQLSMTALREHYLTHAAYYYFRAADSDENLVSALNRQCAELARLRLEQHGQALPSQTQIHARAVVMFGVERCHPAPAATS